MISGFKETALLTGCRIRVGREGDRLKGGKGEGPDGRQEAGSKRSKQEANCLQRKARRRIQEGKAVVMESIVRVMIMATTNAHDYVKNDSLFAVL